jgi:hypothetical protein
MRRSGGSDDELDDELDEVLERRTDRYADELEPMVAAARLLSDAMTAHELGPEVAARHIQMALTRVEHLPAGKRWRAPARVAVTVLLAAAFLLGMTVMASASALPGQVLYPIKRTVEQVQLAMATSPSAKAETHLKHAQTRLTELRALADRDEAGHVPGTISAMQTAVRQANLAVARADRAGVSTTPKLRSQLAQLRQQMVTELMALAAGPPTTSPTQAEAITSAATSVLSSWGISTPPPQSRSPGPERPPATGPPPTGVSPSSSTTVPSTTEGATSSSTVTTTVPSTTGEATSSSTVTTTVPPTTGEATSSSSDDNNGAARHPGRHDAVHVNNQRAVTPGGPPIAGDTNHRDDEAREQADSEEDIRPAPDLVQSRGGLGRQGTATVAAIVEDRGVERIPDVPPARRGPMVLQAGSVSREMADVNPDELVMSVRPRTARSPTESRRKHSTQNRTRHGHPNGHPDDRTASGGTRPDRRGIPREQGQSEALERIRL